MNFYCIEKCSKTFQRAISAILTLVWRKSVLEYQDVIIVLLLSSCSCISSFKRFILLLENVRLTTKRKKCNYVGRTIEYFNQVIQPRRLERATHTMGAFKELKLLSNFIEFCSFLELCRDNCSVFVQICSHCGTTQ